MFLTLMWIVVAAGMVTIITAAIRVQETSVCTGYDVTITGAAQGKLFTSKEQIVKLLKTAANGEITGQRLSEFDLPRIEDLLEQSAWVYNAELYFDNTDRLRINVVERKPLARVFTNLGESFYIDEAGKHIPLSDKISLDVPVFTGYPKKKILNAADSSLMQNVIATASFINNDPFWSLQVSQIDIKNCGPDCWTMNMVPVVGNHRVELGDGDDIAAKFHRLYLFYDQVLKRKGFDKYQKIDVQYDGQVLGVKGDYTKVDSIQLRKNIETLLSQSRQANELIEETPNIGLSHYEADTISANGNSYLNLEPDESQDIATVEVPAAIVAKPPVKETKVPVKKVEKKPEPVKPEPVKAEPKKEVKKVEEKKPVAKTEVKKEVAKEVKKEVKKVEKEVRPATVKPAAKSTPKPVAKKPEPAKEVKRSEVKKPDIKKEPVKTSAKTTARPAEKKPVAAAKPNTTSKKETTTKKKN